MGVGNSSGNEARGGSELVAESDARNQEISVIGEVPAVERGNHQPSEEVAGHIWNVLQLSPDLVKRQIPTFSMMSRFQSSEQYQYMKDELGENFEHARQIRTEISRLTAAMIREQQPLDISVGNHHFTLTLGQAMNVFLASQHARMSTHTPEQRAAYQSRTKKRAGWTAVSLASGIVTLPALFMARYIINEPRKDYDRDPERPEYRAAFDDWMKLIADEGVSAHDRRKLTKTFLDQHMRVDNKLTDWDRANIANALRIGPDSYDRNALPRRRGRRLPPPTDNDDHLYEALAQYASTYVRRQEERSRRHQARNLRRQERNHRPPEGDDGAPPYSPPEPPPPGYDPQR